MCGCHVFAIFDNNILPKLIMNIIKIMVLCFIQITHTDDFPSTGTRLVLILLSIHANTTYRAYLLSCTFLDISPIFFVPLIISFLIMSSLVIPHLRLNIIIHTTSNFFSCAFITSHVSASYIKIGMYRENAIAIQKESGVYNGGNV